MRSFYDPNIDLNATKHILSEEESKHIVRVLRLKVGDGILLINGNGVSIVSSIIELGKKCTVEFKQVIKTEPLDYELHIAIAPTKQNERLEWFIEKATEIGVTKISLLLCDHSERPRIKIDRLEKKAVSAMKQSKRLFAPEISDLTSFNDFVVANPNGLIAHCEEDNFGFVSSEIQDRKCLLLIGPEGDFSSKEIALAKQNGYKAISLGNNRLRTETAAVYACVEAMIQLR